MSYILDALKKSERERSLGHVPTLSTVHAYPKSSSNRRWLWLALALLILLILLGVTIYGVMFWSRGDAVNSASEQSNPVSESVRGVAAPRQPVSSAADKPTPAKMDPPEAKVTMTQPAKQPESALAITAQPSRSYPTIDELDDTTRQNLSDIVVNVVSYSDQPSRRFVMINQKIYRQGQRVNGRVTVVEIKPRGAILRFQGREFLAAP